MLGVRGGAKAERNAAQDALSHKQEVVGHAREVEKKLLTVIEQTRLVDKEHRRVLAVRDQLWDGHNAAVAWAVERTQSSQVAMAAFAIR